MPKISRTYDHGHGDFTITGREKDGLIVGRTTARGRNSGLWVVTHLDSGKSVGLGFRLRKEAIAYRDCLLPLGDWARTKEVLAADTPFWEAARKVARNAHHLYVK